MKRNTAVNQLIDELEKHGFLKGSFLDINRIIEKNLCLEKYQIESAFRAGKRRFSCFLLGLPKFKNATEYYNRYYVKSIIKIKTIKTTKP